MSDQLNDPPVTSLQFDRVTPQSISDVLHEQGAPVCAGCGAAIATEYYQINGNVACESCRNRVEASAETPGGAGPILVAGAYGAGAGIVGAAIYYAVIALLDLEIGIVAILIGYMVGYAVRKGGRGRGGRRFQVLAVALTYGSIALAYTPIVVKAALDADKGKAATAAAAPGNANQQAGTAAPDAATAPASPTAGSGGLILALGYVVLFIAALPLIVVFGSLPSGLISGLIIFFGMSQAWRMTAAPHLQIFGPYRVGATSSPASV
jgi:hypothetical protein